MESHIGNLIAFAHVVREGSVSRAAERLGVSQSAVSQRLKKLEDAVGAKLHFRDRNGFVLTQTGQDVYELADRQADLSQLFAERLRGYGSSEAGQLQIIANAPLPALRLIADFLKVRPRIKIDFTVCDWTTSIELLQARKVDLAVLTEPRASSQWVSIKIGETVYGAYLQEGHPLAGRSEVSIADLAGETLLLPEPGSLTEREFGSAATAVGIKPAKVIRITTFPLMKEAILQGVGVGVFLKDATAATPGLVWRPIPEMSKRYDVCLTVPSGKEDLRLVRLFLESTTDTVR